MNCTFPLAVYGLQDAYSGYALDLKLRPQNYWKVVFTTLDLQHLYESKGEICTPVNFNLSLLSPNRFSPLLYTHTFLPNLTCGLSEIEK